MPEHKYERQTCARHAPRIVVHLHKREQQRLLVRIDVGSNKARDLNVRVQRRQLALHAYNDNLWVGT